RRAAGTHIDGIPGRPADPCADAAGLAQSQSVERGGGRGLRGMAPARVCRRGMKPGESMRPAPGELVRPAAGESMRPAAGSANLERALEHYRDLAPRYDYATRRIDGVRARAIAALRLQPGDVVLDAGCGTGFCFEL